MNVIDIGIAICFNIKTVLITITKHNLLWNKFIHDKLF